MRKLLVGLMGMLSLGALMAVTATSASAAPEWLCAGESILTAGNCTGMTINLGALLLEDMSASGAVECEAETVTSEGAFDPGVTATTTAVTFHSGGKEGATAPTCLKAGKAVNLKGEEVANAIEKVEGVEAANLPWTDAIEQLEGTNNWWILISKKPGYKIKAKASGLSITDECVGVETHTPLVLGENLSETETIEGVAGLLLVSIFFEKKLLEQKGEKEEETAGTDPEAAKCTLGGAESGLVIGEQLLWGLINNAAVSLEIS